MVEFTVEVLSPEKVMKFIHGEMGICIPLNYNEAYYEDRVDHKLQEQIIKFFDEKIPKIEVISESQSTAGTWSSQPWIEVINSLKGLNECFISGWNLTEENLDRLIPSLYEGDIIRRKDNVNIPVLIEWNNSLLKHNSYKRPSILDLWDYGTSGYIVKSQYKMDFIEIVNAESTISFDEISRFFSFLECIFSGEG
ncbi:hypothetical protein [Paenibacillus gorillae]|uniref:hypothetical protein n=1 Tax=Paenibacillus gorillae TaxID=1243662 RepID=UPI0005A95E5A|nr:hypothetical protein [Paenibacillus gorillae]